MSGDALHIDGHAFPVQRGALSRLGGEPGRHAWSIEIHCGESLEPLAEGDDELPWFAGTEPYLYAQMLPLDVNAPNELVGRSYVFTDAPDDDPPGWPCDQWPFFCLYTWEHDLVYPTRLAFLERREGGDYRVRVETTLPSGTERHDVRVEAWIRWEDDDRGRG